VCATKIQIALRQIPILAGESPISASIGIAVLPDDAHDPTSLEQAADRAVYAAKRNGRDRIETATNTREFTATLDPLHTV
jgi:GGDEF domain-containing protein